MIEFIPSILVSAVLLWLLWPKKEKGKHKTDEKRKATVQKTLPDNGLPTGYVIGSQWLQKGIPFKDRFSTLAKGTSGFLAVVLAGYLLVLNSPPEWWFVHRDAYVPVRGLVWASALAALWIAADIQSESGNILMIAFLVTVIIVSWGLSGNSYPMEEMFSPRIERFPSLPYWTELPWGFGKIKFWHIWIVTLALAAFVAILKKPAWGGFLLMTPVFFLWNQLHP